MSFSHGDPLSVLKEFAIPYKDRDSEWVTVQCRYHNDSDDLDKAKAGINKVSGAFSCFSCGHTKGGVFGLVAITHGVPEAVVRAQFDNIYGTANKVGVEPALVAMCHKNLLGDAALMQRMFDKHGITIDSIKKHELGLYPGNGRVTIPIKGAAGNYVDIRQYKYDNGNEPKIISQKKAKTQLFVAGDLGGSETVYLTEGEFKAMLLEQKGLCAVTSTHGASSWSEDFSYSLRGKHVIIVYDVDSAGRNNAVKRCITLHRFAASVKNVFLTDVEDIKGGDITDYFVKRGKSFEDFIALVERTPVYVPPTQAVINVEEDNSDPIALHLSETSSAVYNGKRVSSTCIISAKDTAPYIIPKTIQVVCARSKDYCTNCRLYDKPEDAKFTIPADSVDILHLVGTSSKEDRRSVMMRRSQIYAGCKVSQFNELESYNVEELRVIPQLEVGHATAEQVTRKVYNVGHGISTNASYSINARVCSMPNDGHATLVVYEATPSVDNLDNFAQTQDLAMFTPTEWTVAGINDKLNEIYTDFESNVTRIKQRKDLHLVYDLAYHSVLYFPYEGRNIKGWADILVIGDSGQGKSEASGRMQTHYRAGERVDSKRASVAGIVGGLQETSNRWFITWGTIPLNDRRLVILEEVKGMGVGELTKLTDMRSSGFAEIHKIERAKTYARTRLVWISNPRSDGKINSYNYGVDAVRELIGSLEDIRRFDLVCAVASGEVPKEVINSPHVVTMEHKYTSDACAELVQWAWSRKEHQIKFDNDAVLEALAAAMRLGNTYSSAIPIVESSDQRLKMLRLATALAARTFSTDDKGECIIVRKCHVEVVEQLMERLYRSKALGYYDFSIAMKGEEKVTDTNAVVGAIGNMPHAKDCARGLLESEIIRMEDVQNFTEWPVERCNEFIGLMIRNNCLKRHRRGGYRKTSSFIDMLKELDRKGDLQNVSFKQKIQTGSEL